MRQKETEQELARTGTGARQENFMFWARLRCRFGGDQRRDTGRQPTATPKMAFGTGSGVTLKSVTGSTGLQNEGLNMLSRKPEVRREMGAKDLRQQGNGIKRDGQTSPARDHRPVVG